MVLNTHLMAPVAASAATTRPPGMFPSEIAEATYSVLSWYAGELLMR